MNGLLDLRMLPIKSLVPHEQYEEDHVLEVMGWIERDCYLERPVAVYSLDGHEMQGKFLILDGHHRTESLRRLQYNYIMANKIKYFDPIYKIFRWNNGVEIPKERPIELAQKGELFPPKTTNYTVILDGQEPQPFYNNNLIEPVMRVPLKQLKVL